ncbi:hypothetical protein MOUN0_D02036 [Monosporozyma unispora]|nr:hypothetical protein C6P44_002554 [Kazachstania unispora]
MSSNINTPTETPKEVTPVDSILETINNEDTKTTTIENALPWDNIDHQIPIKSFSGYTVKLNGWVRHDIREQRELEEKERLAKEKIEKEKEAREKLEKEQQQQVETELSKTTSPAVVAAVSAPITTSNDTNITTLTSEQHQIN